MGKSMIFFASMGSTTMGRMQLFCPTTTGRLFILSLFCVSKGFTGVVVVFACTGYMRYITCVDDRITYLVRKHVRIQLETLTSLGKLSTDKNSTPGSKTTKPPFRACKYILSPCNKSDNKTLFINVVFDQSISGIFWAVKSADKLIKAHYLPLD
jgi:hypothetical protein